MCKLLLLNNIKKTLFTCDRTKNYILYLNTFTRYNINMIQKLSRDLSPRICLERFVYFQSNADNYFFFLYF